MGNVDSLHTYEERLQNTNKIKTEKKEVIIIVYEHGDQTVGSEQHTVAAELCHHLEQSNKKYVKSIDMLYLYDFLLYKLLHHSRHEPPFIVVKWDMSCLPYLCNIPHVTSVLVTFGQCPISDERESLIFHKVIRLALDDDTAVMCHKVWHEVIPLLGEQFSKELQQQM